MKRFLTGFALLVLATVSGMAQDPATVTPKQCKVELENDYVRVLHWRVGPHEKVPMHDHPALVSVALSGAKSRFTSPDGKTRDVESKAGQVTWSGPERHSSEELDGKVGEVIQVELKKSPGAGAAAIPSSEDAVQVDPKHYKVELQNDRVRVLKIKYGPNEKSVMHGHPAAVAVFLTDGESKFSFPDGKTVSNSVKAGEVRWTDRQVHLPENTGSKPFEVVVVELR